MYSELGCVAKTDCSVDSDCTSGFNYSLEAWASALYSEAASLHSLLLSLLL